MFQVHKIYEKYCPMSKEQKYRREKNKLNKKKLDRKLSQKNEKTEGESKKKRL